MEDRLFTFEELKEAIEIAVYGTLKELGLKTEDILEEEGEIDSNNHEILLKIDLAKIKQCKNILSDLNTENAKSTIEEFKVLDNIEESISDIESFLVAIEEGEAEYKSAMEEGRTVSSYLHE